MSDTALIWRISYTFILCWATFIATRYGKAMWNRLTRARSDSSVATIQRAYDEVHVLLLSWDGADSRFYKQLLELRNVFQDYYNYEEGDSDIEEFSIPSEDAKNALDDKLSKFLQKDGPRSLLILYYGGHGALNVGRRAIWKKFEKDGPEIPWHDLQTKLFERKSDILLLIDCCAAAGSQVPVGATGMVEVEFAGGFEAPTPIWGPHSFTVNLVSELKKVHDSGTSVLKLHRNVSTSLQHPRTQDDGRERRANPHHEWLAEPEPLRSIHLQSLLSTAPIQLQNAARTQTTTLQRARSFDIVKLQAKIKEIHKWLEPVDQSKFHNTQVAAQEKETGGWIFDHPLFASWKNGSKLFLAIYGTAGCGKTVLCASIADYMEAVCRSRDGSNQRDLVAKFYFSFEIFSPQQDLECLLKSIIQQLSFAPEIFSELRDIYEEHNKIYPPSSPSISELQKILISGLRGRCSNTDTPRNVFLVIDALDEIPKGSGREEVIDFLKELAACKIPFLHVLITCRPDTDITTRISGPNNLWTGLSVDKEAVRLDIGKYVNNVLKQGDFAELPDDTKDKIRDRLTKDQDGMFRWAKLQIEELKRLDPVAPETVEPALATLPPDLNASYLKLLMGIHPVYQQQAMNALWWLCLATRPLYIEEIVEICSIFPGENPGFRESRRFARQTYPVAILKDLIAVVPPLDGSPPCPRTNIVKLGHFSVKEYLTGPDIMSSAASKYQVTSDTNKFIAESCLVYLFHNNRLAKRHQEYSLREYAWNQWAWHGVEADLSTRLQVAIQLFDSCVYAPDPSEGFENLRMLGLLDWLYRLPGRAATIQILQSALRNPYFYEEFRIPVTGTDPNLFRYQPVEGPSTIRLLRILPSEYDSPEIRCELVHESLEGGVRYDAISYTWSYQPERSAYIRLNGQPLAVRAKVAGILRILRGTGTKSPRTVWIDGVCIDMQNLPERSVQVGLMARIYQEAKEVAVMLEDDSVHPNALRMLKRLSSLLDDDDDALDEKLERLRNLVVNVDSEASWNSIFTLFSQAWWKRMWPIQEILLASKATIIYGKTPVNFDVIQRVMVNEIKTGKLPFKVGRDTWPLLVGLDDWYRARALGELRLVMQEKGRVELPHLLYATRFNNVTFHPDRVFSIYPLSLIGSKLTEVENELVVNYELQTEQVFMNCSKYLLLKYRNLDALSYVTSYYEGDCRYALPSWASTFKGWATDSYLVTFESTSGPERRPGPPNYLQLVKGKFQPSEGDDVYEACGDERTSEIAFKEEFELPANADQEMIDLWAVERQLTYLVLDGICVDRIEFPKRLKLSSYPSGTWSGNPLFQMTSAFWTGTSQEMDTESMWRTIVADQWEIGTRKSRKFIEFLSMDQETQVTIEPDGLKFTEGRRIFRSNKGYFGLGPSHARPGDFIFVLPGGKVPYIFRGIGYNPSVEEDISALPVGRNALPDLRLVGECYVHGIMDGEIMRAAKAGEYEFQELRIV